MTVWGRGTHGFILRYDLSPKNVRSFCSGACSGAEYEVWARYFLVSVCK